MRPSCSLPPAGVGLGSPALEIPRKKPQSHGKGEAVLDKRSQGNLGPRSLPCGLILKAESGAMSLVVQGLRTYLAMQGTQGKRPPHASESVGHDERLRMKQQRY